jgi:hypothetical protein
MPAKKQQTHAKRARELAVREKRERKQAKKAEARAARDEPVVDADFGDEDFGEGASPVSEEDETAGTPSVQEIG